MKSNQLKKSAIFLLLLTVLFTSCKKENPFEGVRLDSYEFAWTGKNDLSWGGSSFRLKVFVNDPLGKLNAGSTWVETVGSQLPNSFAIGKPVDNTVIITGGLSYGGPTSTNTVIPYKFHLLLNDGTSTNELKFNAIRQPGAN